MEENSKNKRGRVAKLVDTKCGVGLFKVIGSATSVEFEDAPETATSTRTDTKAVQRLVESMHLE